MNTYYIGYECSCKHDKENEHHDCCCWSIFERACFAAGEEEEGSDDEPEEKNETDCTEEDIDCCHSTSCVGKCDRQSEELEITSKKTFSGSSLHLLQS